MIPLIKSLKQRVVFSVGRVSGLYTRVDRSLLWSGALGYPGHEPQHSLAVY